MKQSWREKARETIEPYGALIRTERPDMNQETLQELFVEQIRDLYDAEKQLVKALPKMIKAVEFEELSTGLRNHLEETQGHVSRLETVFELAGVPAKGKTCKAMKGLVEEGGEAIQEQDKGELRDLAIIAAAQRVEHYEISAYGTARTIAEHLGMDEAAELLQETEDEEKAADSNLTKAATSLYGSSSEEGEEEMAAAAGAGRGAGSSSKRGNGGRKTTR
jgi:ferritin-like metal-binding protein YciE